MRYDFHCLEYEGLTMEDILSRHTDYEINEVDVPGEKAFIVDINVGGRVLMCFFINDICLRVYSFRSEQKDP